MHDISLNERLQGSIWGQFAGNSIKSDELTYYSEAGLLMLNSLVNKKRFSARDFGTRFVETFASRDYAGPASRTISETLDNYRLSLEVGHPDLGYEFQGGANTADVDTATRLAPLVVLYRDSDKLLSKVDKATRVTQNNEFAIAYMRSYARILNYLIQGESLREAFIKEAETKTKDSPIDHHVQKKIKQALSLESLSIIEATKQLGIGSYLDQSFPAAIHAALKHSDSIEKTFKEIVHAEGDYSGRAALVGSWLGANLGIKAFPESSRKHILNYQVIDNEIQDLLNITLS